MHVAPVVESVDSSKSSFTSCVVPTNSPVCEFTHKPPLSPAPALVFVKIDCSSS
jgi:hypothetical protein